MHDSTVQEEQKKYSRRSFLRGVGALSAGVAASTLVGCDASVEQTVKDPVEGPSWDHEADIVVCGYGGAGAITAICAHDAGSSVLILEKQPQDTPDKMNQTNSTRMSTASTMSFKSEQDAIDYLTASSMGRTPDDVIASWAKYACKVFDFMTSIGAPIINNERSGSEYSLELFPQGETYWSCSYEGQGIELWDSLDSAVKERGIEVIFDSPAKELITNAEREVIGVIAEKNGEKIRVKAKKAVVLGTGGFEHDPEMVKQFIWADPVKFYANPDNNGDGVKMAQDVGADLWHMYLAGGRFVPFIPDLGYALQNGSNDPFVYVTKYGKRFYKENWRNHSVLWEGFRFMTDYCDFVNTPCFQVFDQTAMDVGPVVRGGMMKVGAYEWSKDNSKELAAGWIIKGDTLEELAEAIAKEPEVGDKMDPAVFAETIATYNGYCEAGEDLEFGRDPKGLIPLVTPPFYALKMYPGGVNTFGGPRRNAKGQIVRPNGEPVGRLYGVGELGSVQGFLYSGGGWNICEIATSGQLAAEFASQETAWEA